VYNPRFPLQWLEISPLVDINLSSFIWSVADLLSGDYKQSAFTPARREATNPQPRASGSVIGSGAISAHNEIPRNSRKERKNAKPTSAMRMNRNAASAPTVSATDAATQNARTIRAVLVVIGWS